MFIASFFVVPVVVLDALRKQLIFSYTYPFIIIHDLT